MVHSYKNKLLLQKVHCDIRLLLFKTEEAATTVAESQVVAQKITASYNTQQRRDKRSRNRARNATNVVEWQEPLQETKTVSGVKIYQTILHSSATDDMPDGSSTFHRVSHGYG
jgi:hypothetical protein